ncbi:hypothetical protein PWT90_06823 [Aphanocladium album]|nr:hypothetical protein PWT90_06823 [Aphanocladium album]
MDSTWHLYDGLGHLMIMLDNLATHSPSENERRLVNIMSLGRDSDKADWGITVIRVDYNAPQTQLLNALSCINDAVQRDLGAAQVYREREIGTICEYRTTKHGWPVCMWRKAPRSAGDDLFAAYKMELLSHFHNLNMATAATVRRKFQDWIVQKQGNTHGGDMRYVFCVILDADTIQQLNEIWCLGSRVATKQRQLQQQQQQVQVKVLDAVPGDDCRGVYKVNLAGVHGLVNFWFTRSLRRHPLEFFLERPSDDGGMWCFRSAEREPLPAMEELQVEEEAAQRTGKRAVRERGGWKGKNKKGVKN